MRQYTYHKNERLKKRNAIDALFKEGKTFGAYPLRVYYRLLPATPDRETAEVIQAGVSVSKKHFKRAVHRNRIKRLMREAYRLQKGGLILALRSQGLTMHVFLIYTGKELPLFEEVKDKLQAVLQRLEKEIATP